MTQSESTKPKRKKLSHAQYKKIGRASKAKGGRREREWCIFLRENGATSARRTQQFCGRMGDSDVVAEELSCFHQEVKGQENLNPHKAVEQAVADSAKTGLYPIVAHKKSNKDWLVYMRAADWLCIMLQWEKDRRRFTAEVAAALEGEHTKFFPEPVQTGESLNNCLNIKLPWEKI